MRIKHLLTASFVCALAGSCAAHAQIALSTAIDLALRNSPRVRMAQADLAKAKASLTEAKAAFIPVVQTTGGYGRSTGAPLSVPVIFSFSAQSLVFTFSQPDYIRSARAGVDAAEHALHEAQIEVAEDTTNTFVALNNAVLRRAVLQQEQDITGRLVQVTSDRVDANIDAHTELTKARRTSVQVRFQLLLIDDEIAANTRHLASLTGVSTAGLTTDPASVPKFSRPVAARQTTDTQADSEGTAAAFSNARAKQYVAHGDLRYLFRPQIGLSANYSRVDAGLSSYGAYYPRFAGTPDHPNSNNSLGIGLQINIPLLDLTHRAKARESAADAAHAWAEAEMQRGLFQEGRAKLRNAALELDARAELAQLDRDLAQDQLDALEVQLQANAAGLQGNQATPKDELNARLQERQKYLDVLNADLQLQQTQVNLLRQEGGLGDWIHNSIGVPGSGTTLPAAHPMSTIPGSSPTAPLPTPLNTPTAAPVGTPPASTSPRP